MPKFLLISISEPLCLSGAASSLLLVVPVPADCELLSLYAVLVVVGLEVLAGANRSGRVVSHMVLVFFSHTMKNKNSASPCRVAVVQKRYEKVVRQASTPGANMASRPKIQVRPRRKKSRTLILSCRIAITCLSVTELMVRFFGRPHDTRYTMMQKTYGQKN